MKLDLMGKIALVTGGSRGIGHAICRALADAGAHVALCARDGVKAEQVAGALGRTDILVNNAGFTRDKLVFRIKETDWDTVVDTNLKGAFLMTKYAARGMIKRRWGRVVNISSVVGINGNKGQSNYAASKAGLVGFTKAVAKDLASRNVLVNAVAPGYIDTERTSGITA